MKCTGMFLLVVAACLLLVVVAVVVYVCMESLRSEDRTVMVIPQAPEIIRVRYISFSGRKEGRKEGRKDLRYTSSSK